MQTTIPLSERVLASFLLGAIGDALGAPVEMMTKDAIREKYGRVTNYLADPNHRFGPIATGETTDDTQLKLAIARSIARTGMINLDDIAREHVLELKKTTRGWGGSTTKAVEKLATGVQWIASGTRADPNQKRKGLGKGNGVAMKIDPVGAFYATQGVNSYRDRDAMSNIQFLSLMTHATDMGYASGLAQVVAIHSVMTEEITTQHFASAVTWAAQIGETIYPWNKRSAEDDLLSNRFKLLADMSPEMSDEEIRSKFGTGACYVYESLPLAYALFLRKPHSIEALYDAVNWGGDSDTVASIVGSLLGALNGMEIVPMELAMRLDRYDEIVETHKQFCLKLEIS